MKKMFFLAAIFCSSMMFAQDAEIISVAVNDDLAPELGWVTEQSYPEFSFNDYVAVGCVTNGSNGVYYETDKAPGDWRIYQARGVEVVGNDTVYGRFWLKGTKGAKILKVKFTYYANQSKGGGVISKTPGFGLTDTVATDEVLDFGEGVETVTLYAGMSQAATSPKAQVRIQAFLIQYIAGGEVSTVEFHYLPTAGDQPSGVESAFNTSDKIKVPAGTQFIAGDAFDVYNAYETTYKAVGVMADTAYAAAKIGDVEVSLLDSRIQGQDNPKASGDNPATTMTAPNTGACYKVDVKKDGYLYVITKSTPNKHQFAFEGVVENEGIVAGFSVGYTYAMMSVNSNENPIGNPDGCLRLIYKGDENNYNHLMSPVGFLQDPYEWAGGTYSTNGVGVLTIPVFVEGSPYIIGTAGSKMMAAGFGFSETEQDVWAIGSKNVAKHDGKSFDDVQLTGAAVAENTIVVDLSKKEADPIKVSLTIPEAWNHDTDTTFNKMYYSVDNGTWKEMTKGNGVWEASIKDWDGFSIKFQRDYNGELDIFADYISVAYNNITEDICLVMSLVANDYCTLTTCGGTDLDEIQVENLSAKKVMIDGNMFILREGALFNALGAQVK